MEKLPFEQRKYKVLIKREAKTEPNQGSDPNKRPIEELICNGIINLNKPAGPTSQQTVSYVKNILKIKSAGHSGTLDPNVSGVLPIALDRATRIVQATLNAGKEYICLMHLHKDIPKEEIKKTFPKFVKKITQLPPLRSAVKRQERQREIYYLKILEIDERDILFKVGSEGGTYIRRLCEQLGEKLGTKAHMQQLIRTKAGPFKKENWHSLHDLKDAYEFYKEGNEKQLRKIILPIESATQHLKKVYTLDSAINTLCHGASLSIPGISKLDSDIKKNDLIAILTLKEELVGLGISNLTSKEIQEKEKGLAIRIKKVFMKRNTYK
tara:strand:- start:129 stop:1100 length:972 start_codon:yes stop_codon:yes gene_type:complete